MADSGFKNENGFPLSASQTAIWTGQRLNPTVPLYNTFFRIEIRGKLDRERFRDSFLRLVSSSDSLRSVFREKEDGTPYRDVLSEPPSKLELIECSTEDEIDAVESVMGSEDFELDSCAYRSKLVSIGSDQHVWLFNQHHIIADAQSVALQNELLWQFYEENSDVNPDVVDFAEYLSFEASSASSVKEEYWSKFERPLENHPLFASSGSEKSTKAARTSVQIGSERNAKVNEYLRNSKVFAGSFSEDLSRYVFLGGALLVFLKRLLPTAQTTIGTPNHNRVNPSFKKTIGLLMEILPVDYSFEEDAKVSDVLEGFRDKIYENLKNSSPGTTSAELLSGINYVYNYIPAEFSFPEQFDCTVKWLHPGHQDADHQIRLEYHDFQKTGNPTLDFDLAKYAFESVTGERVAELFLRLLDRILEDDSQTVSSLEIYTLGTRTAANTTDALSVADPIEAFEAQVETSPDAIAITDSEKSWTYAKLDERSNRVAAFLADKEEKYIAVDGKRLAETVASILGILKAGKAYIPLNPDIPEKRIKEIVKDASMKTLLSVGEIEKNLEDVEIIDVRSLPTSKFETSTFQQDDVAYVIYTSGSTGKPKGAANSRKQVALLVDRLRKHIYEDLSGRLEIGLLAPFGFDASVQQIFPALLFGHTLHIAPECARFSVSDLIEFFNKKAINVSDGTPAHLRILRENKRPVLLPKNLIIGGEALQSSLVEDFSVHFGHPDTTITNVYGLAECGVDSVAYDIDLHEPNLSTKDVPIGRPLDGVRVYVCNSAGKSQPNYVTGEIYIAGDSVGVGYVGSNGDNDRFIDDPYCSGARALKTGDLGYFDDQGVLHFLGRADDQISLNGLRIEPAELENALTGFSTKTPFFSFESTISREPVRCKECLLHDQHPGVKISENGTCNVCIEFERLKPATEEFFGASSDFKATMSEKMSQSDSEYDCLLLYSGGKDSSYVLTKLVEDGYKVLAYTFDNGFISEGAFRNIARQTERLGVTSIVESIDQMDEVFVESLRSDSTVCTGCFKALTSRSTIIAEEHGINVVVTGLSRGQIYETKLAALFSDGITDPAEVDRTLLEFRKMFHVAKDRTGELLGETPSEESIENIWFVDYFRYDDVAVDEVLSYLTKRDDYWTKPKDVGFCSSNCLINEVGIAVHSETKGYHNYEAPLSWDIRLGIAERDSVVEEVVGTPKTDRVNRILNQIGFYENSVRDCIVVVNTNSSGDEYLCAYYTADRPFDPNTLRSHLSTMFPQGMIPTRFVHLDSFPLTPNGKVDKRALSELSDEQPSGLADSAPENEIEEIMHSIWSDVLGVHSFGTEADFFDLGGQSLSAIRIISRLIDEFGLNLAVGSVFANPSVRMLSQHVESEMEKIMAGEARV